ncbi:DUF397 domain-containing protein [Streptomyces sp. NPDC017056]|uniref:DUF397 domain-containing protein n=1 Tax=Streptomyces sp. NPDC017056 TaxID=3364973 RepID=UPI00378BCA00
MPLPLDISAAHWRKSSYSNTNGGNCVEIAEDFIGAAHWHKSSHSNTNGGSCVEVADDLPGTVPVRDSKNPHGRILTFPSTSWGAFIASLKTAEG